MSKLSWSNQVNFSELERLFQPLGGQGKALGLDTEKFFMQLRNEQDYLLAYNSCPPLKAIIGKKAKAFNTGQFEVLNSNTKNYAKGILANDVLELLRRPNALQTSRQFMSQHNTYIDLFGYCPVLKVKSEGFEVPSAIWNIPPWLFDLQYGKDFLYATEIEDAFKKFYLVWNGERVTLDAENLFFVFDDGIGTDSTMALTIPDSRLVSLEYPVSNTIAAYKSRNTLIVKRGAIGILTNDARDQAGTIPLKSGHKDAVQNDFKKYGLVGQPYQVIISEAALKWQQMGFPTKELMLFEEIQESIERICDGYGWPVELISRSKDVTFDNKKQATKSAYRDTIIPESDARMEQFSINIIPKGINMVIRRDYSDVEILQEDTKDKADARKAQNDALKIEWDNGLITKNDWLEALGKDRIANPLFDLYIDEYNKTTKPINKDEPTPEN